MNIFASLPGFYKLVRCLKDVRPDKKAIEAARAAGDHELERECILKATSYWGPLAMKLLDCTVTTHGLENLPDKGPVVMVGNHQGYSDILTYFAAFRKFQFGFVAKESLTRMPFYGSWLERVRSVLIPTGDPRAALRTINKGIEYLEEGFSLVIYPEGTRSRGPEPGPFQKGALKLATKPEVPIVPVSIEGTYKMFEAEGRIRPANVHIMVHEPIETKGLSRQEQKALSDKVEKIVKDGIKELQAIVKEEEKGADQ